MTAVLNHPKEDHPMTPPPPDASANTRGPVQSGELWRWVDRLTRDRTQRLVRQLPGTKPSVEYVPVPSLWTQLQEAVASTNGGGGRGKSSTGSRSPLDLEVEALMMEISASVVKALRDLGEKPRIGNVSRPAGRRVAAPRLLNEYGHPIYDPQTAGLLSARASSTAADRVSRRDLARVLHDTKSDLRQLPAVLVTTGRADLINTWTDRYRRWVLRAETTLTADDESIDMRAIRGHACPVCLTLWVTSDRDGETFRDPALVIAFRDGQVQHITCRACDTGWWRGEDIDELRRQLTTNEAIYGPASTGWGLITRRAEA